MVRKTTWGADDDRNILFLPRCEKMHFHRNCDRKWGLFSFRAIILFLCVFGKKNFQFELNIWIRKFLNHDFKSMKVYFSLVFMFMCYAPWVHTNVIYYSYVDLYIYHVFSNFGNSRTAKITNNSNCGPDILCLQLTRFKIDSSRMFGKIV